MLWTLAEKTKLFLGKVTFGLSCTHNALYSIFKWSIVPISMEIRHDRKRLFCAADVPLSNKKKNSAFGRTIVEIFNFYSGKVTFGPPCIRQHCYIYLPVFPLLVPVFKKYWCEYCWISVFSVLSDDDKEISLLFSSV